MEEANFFASVGMSKSAVMFLFGEAKAETTSCGDEIFTSVKIFVADSRH